MTDRGLGRTMPERKLARGDIVAKKTYPPLTGRVTQLNSNGHVQFANVFWFYGTGKGGGTLEARIPVGELLLVREVFK